MKGSGVDPQESISTTVMSASKATLNEYNNPHWQSLETSLSLLSVTELFSDELKKRHMWQKDSPIVCQYHPLLYSIHRHTYTEYALANVRLKGPRRWALFYYTDISKRAPFSVL